MARLSRKAMRLVRREGVSKSSSAIEELGGELSDVTRTRILLTRIEDWEQVAAVHGESFGNIRPANAIMQVVRFIDPDWLIEIEADAIVES
jgi:enamine deaminase RidA (YjgF/YER057c/UK114 family)